MGRQEREGGEGGRGEEEGGEGASTFASVIQHILYQMLLPVVGREDRDFVCGGKNGGYI